jgi:hypothetical protein
MLMNPAVRLRRNRAIVVMFLELGAAAMTAVR